MVEKIYFYQHNFKCQLEFYQLDCVRVTWNSKLAEC